MNILKLIAQLTLDGTGFKAGLKEAEVAANKFANSIGSELKGQLATAFGAGALIAFVKDALHSTAALKDLAEQSHMTTDEVQYATEAAKDMGLEFSDVAQAERQFNQQRREAAEGNEELRKTFAKYGMTLADLNDPQIKFFDFLIRASAAMEGMSDEEKQRGLSELHDMLGKMGPKLQEFIKQLNEARNTPIVDKDTINDIDAAEDALGKLWRRAKGEAAMNLTGRPLLDLFKATFGTSLSEMIFGKEPASPAPLPGLGGGAWPPGAMFEDKAAQKAADERAAAFQKDNADAIKDLTEAAFKFTVANARTSGEKRAILEDELGGVLQDIRAAESLSGGPSTGSLRDRKTAFDLLTQLSGLKNEPLEAGSLTKVGQFGGRNLVSGGESEVVRAAKELLTSSDKNGRTLESIDRKVKPGQTLNADV